MALLKQSRTFIPTTNHINKKWFVIDASKCVLGRMASKVALMLRGKHKRCYTPNINCGDSIVVVNAKSVKVTGKKLDKRKFYWHTGYPGGIKDKTWREIIEGKYPERLIMKAVERMMPKDSPLAREQMRSLYVYPESDHPHAAQMPQSLEL